MQVRVLAFARVREVLNYAERRTEFPAGSSVRDAWAAVVDANPELRALAGSLRVARNGKLVRDLNEALAENDELAFLPPVGGG